MDHILKHIPSPIYGLPHDDFEKCMALRKKREEQIPMTRKEQDYMIWNTFSILSETQDRLIFLMNEHADLLELINGQKEDEGYYSDDYPLEEMENEVQFDGAPYVAIPLSDGSGDGPVS